MTGTDCKRERTCRRLTLAEVAAQLEGRDRHGNPKRGVTRGRVHQIEIQGELSAEEAGRVVVAIMDAEALRNKALWADPDAAAQQAEFARVTGGPA